MKYLLSVVLLFCIPSVNAQVMGKVIKPSDRQEFMKGCIPAALKIDESKLGIPVKQYAPCYCNRVFSAIEGKVVNQELTKFAMAESMEACIEKYVTPNILPRR